MKKIILFVVIPALLIVFWVAGSLVFNNLISFSVLVYQHPKSDFKQLPAQKLLKGDKIVGEFKANENHLGLIELRFNNYVKYDFAGEDLLTFALKEKGSKNWYVFSYYKSGLLEHNLLFPFGFYPISDSKGKTYQFEIDSLYGNNVNAVQVDKNHLTLLTGYQIPKSEILASKKLTLIFLFKKFITSFTNVDFLLTSSFYLLPLLLYCLILFGYFSGKWKSFMRLLPFLTMVLILLDIFLLKQMYLGVQILLLALWVYCVVKYKVTYKTSLLFSAFLILCWMVLLLIHDSNFQDKINFWVYEFLFVTAISATFEEKFKKK